MSIDPLSRVLAGLGLAVFVLAADLAQAAGVVPHRAIYRLSLEEAQGAQEIQDAGGLIAFQWNETCEAIEITEAYSILLYVEGGQVSEFGAHFEGIEHPSTGRFQFRFEQSGAGETLSVEGAAEPADGQYRLDLRPPEASGRTLPGNVVFPAGHTLALMKAAKAGEKFLSHLVFDGSDLDGPAQITAVIGRPRAVQAELGSSQAWPVTLSFFSYGSTEETPSYQLSMLLRENGIASDLRLDYGDFVLRGRLDRLEERPVPVCE